MRRRIARRLCDVGRFPALVAKRSFCRGRLAACEVPRLVVFRDSLPNPAWGNIFGASCGICSRAGGQGASENLPFAICHLPLAIGYWLLAISAAAVPR